MTESYFRRHYPVVHRGRQYRLLVLILTYGLLICIYLFLCMFLPDIIQMQDPTEPFDIRARAADRLLSMHSRLWPAVIAVLGLVGLHSFRMFTRLVGPLVPMRHAFERIAKGDLTFRVTLRKRDLLTEEAEQINEMSESISDRIRNAQYAAERAAEVSANLDTLVKDHCGELPDKLNDTVTEVNQRITACRDIIDAFKVDADMDESAADVQPVSEMDG